MLKIADKLKKTGSTKRFALMQLIFFASIISASGQSFSNYEIIKLININVLQIDIPSIENSNNNDLGDWIVSEGNASLVVQDGNRNHTSIEQISGIGNVAKALQQAHNKQTGHEYSGKRECVIYQLKSINYTEIKQYGNQNRSETLQNGNSNEINIVQHGGRSFFIDYKNFTNKSFVSQIGYSNSATISQTFYP